MGKLKVGSYVYPYMIPSKIGIIEQDYGPEVCKRLDGGTFVSGFRVYSVKWLTGKEKGLVKKVNEIGLKDYEELIESHKRKYENQLAALNKVR